MATGSILDSTQARWELAIRAVQDAGVQVTENVDSCCGGCVVPADHGIDEAMPYAWTPGYQGRGYEWQAPNLPVHFEDEPRSDDEEEGDERTYGEPVKHIYFNHDHDAAPAIVEAFTAQGFTTEWNGSDAQCVMVLLPTP